VPLGQPPASSAAATAGAQAAGVTTAPTKPAAKPQAAANPVPAAGRVGGAAIDLRYVCDLRMKWSDEGSGARSDVALYEPVPPPGYFIIGGYAQANYAEPHGCVAAIKPLVAHLALAPSGWKQLWTDEGSGAQRDGSLWQAVPASEDFVCLGAVAQAGYKQPALSNYACVHRCMVRDMPPSRPLWTDEGTGARSPVAIYQAPLTNAMVVSPNRGSPPAIRDLDPMAACLYGG
jgi:hypothetical protein